MAVSLCNDASNLFKALGYNCTWSRIAEGQYQFELDYCAGEMILVDAHFHTSGPTFAFVGLGNLATSIVSELQNAMQESLSALVTAVNPSMLIFESLRFVTNSISRFFRAEIQTRAKKHRESGARCSSWRAFCEAALLEIPGMHFLSRNDSIAMSIPLWKISEAEGPPSIANGARYRIDFISEIGSGGNATAPKISVFPRFSQCDLPVFDEDESLENFVCRIVTKLRSEWAYRQKFFTKLGELFRFTLEWDRVTQTRRSFLVTKPLTGARQSVLSDSDRLCILHIETASTRFPNESPSFHINYYRNQSNLKGSSQLTVKQLPFHGAKLSPEEAAVHFHRQIADKL